MKFEKSRNKVKPRNDLSKLRSFINHMAMQPDCAKCSASSALIFTLCGILAFVDNLCFLADRKDDLVLPLELRNALQDYINKQNLINENDHAYITLNDALSSALLKKGEDSTFMPRSEVNRRFIDNLQAWHRVVINEGGKREEIIGKGAPEKIGIAVKKRQGKKLVTIIDGEYAPSSFKTLELTETFCRFLRPGNISHTTSKACRGFTSQMCQFSYFWGNSRYFA